MSPTVPAILGASFWHRYEHELTAALSVIVALVVATLVDRALARRGRLLAATVVGGRMTPVLDTRLRFARRLVYAFIVLFGVALALAQFSALDRLASGVLASGAIAAAVVGFAARQTLANAVAGILLAITQPLRIGDQVTFEGESGEVEDVRLTYTYLRTPGGSRIVIPNERLASGVLRNDSILGAPAQVEVSLWLPRDADAGRAAGVVAEEVEGARASIAEVGPDGVRISVLVDLDPGTPRSEREAQLRAESLAALRAHDIA